jgi:predicted DNA-binding protein YlxM (UPF0122 family)
MGRKTNEDYSLLYDFYGSLLTERQREVFDLYHEENFSLSEIAERLGVSRQAIHISLGKARQELEEYEEKLGLIAKHAEYEKVLDEIESKIDIVLKDKERMISFDTETAKVLRRVKKLIKGLDL